MLEFIEKVVLSGVGALSLTQQKAEELLTELKEKANLTEEEGKQLLERLQEAARENQKKLEELAQEEVQKACQRLGVVTVEEFSALKKKVAQLEKQAKAQSK